MSEERKLATLRKVDAVYPIEGADNIEAAQFGGWTVVIKKGDAKPGDTMVFCEIDSVMPDLPAYEFLKPKRFRIKTMRLKGVLSQGIAFNLKHLAEEHRVMIDPIGDTYYKLAMAMPKIALDRRLDMNTVVDVLSDKDSVSEANIRFDGDIISIRATINRNFDLTHFMGITKYEPPQVSDGARFGGDVGEFFRTVPKTDEERIQNLTNELRGWCGLTFHMTEKIDGTSCTMKLNTHTKELEVCARNTKKVRGDGLYWEQAVKYGVEEKLRACFESTGADLALQGEIAGPGIQGNRYKMTERDYLIFKIFDNTNRRFLTHDEMVKFCGDNSLKTVPYLGSYTWDKYSSWSDILKMADGKSSYGTPNREGIVFSTTVDPNFRGSRYGQLSFKAISNKYLLKTEE